MLSLGLDAGICEHGFKRNLFTLSRSSRHFIHKETIARIIYGAVVHLILILACVDDILSNF